MRCETVITPVESSDCVPACVLLTVNVQMVVGGCRLTLLACTLCTPALSDLAERHFDWSHFCQTRQATTHLGIQGVPADKSPTCTHDYPDEVPGSREQYPGHNQLAPVTTCIKGTMKGFLAEYLHTFALFHIRERPCWQFATVALSL